MLEQLATIPKVSTLADTDLLPLLRAGVPYALSLNTLNAAVGNVGAVAVTLSGDAVNWNPTKSQRYYVTCSGSTRVIESMKAGEDGEERIVTNVGALPLLISLAEGIGVTNAFVSPESNAEYITLRRYESVRATYSKAIGRWIANKIHANNAIGEWALYPDNTEWIDTQHQLKVASDGEGVTITSPGSILFQVYPSHGICLFSYSSGFAGALLDFYGIISFQWASSVVSNDVTNATTTMADTTLSVPLLASAIHEFEAFLIVNESTAADGIKVSLANSDIAASSINAVAEITDSNSTQTTRITSTADVVTKATFTGTGFIRIRGVIKTTGAYGSLKVQFAQGAHTTGTATVYANSFLRHNWLGNV